MIGAGYDLMILLASELITREPVVRQNLSIQAPTIRSIGAST